MVAAKIAVIGDINGKFLAVFQKLAALHSKQNFSFALIVGNLFAEPSTATLEDQGHIENLINGTIKVALPIYFALGAYPLPQPVIDKLNNSEGELCPNLYYLGRRTTTKTSEGVRIVALGGSFNTDLSVGVSKDKYTPVYSEDDAKALRGANQADILVTSQWPAEIRTGSKMEVNAHVEPVSQKCVADLCATLKPRYHFSTSPSLFFEREPFFHPPSDEASDVYHITRFLSLAGFGNPGKQKWIYAFSIDPAAAPPVTIPTGTTGSPLLLIKKKRPALPDEASYRFSSGDSHGYSRARKRQRAPPSQSECFFCLANPNLATHLIVSIGTEAYLTTAKGPLSTASTYSSLPFPGHMLIVPMAHSATLSLISDPESRSNTVSEMHQYRNALQAMLDSQSKGELGAVTWEVSRAGGFHTHWQFLPVPLELIHRLVEAAFRVEAENNKYPSIEKGEPDESADYFRIWIWDPSTKKDSSLWLTLDASFRDLQYARRVLAKLLGLEGRIHWQDCGQTHDEEVADAEAFKSAFKPFDFTEE